MKKGVIIYITVLILLIVVTILFLNYQKNTYDKTQEEDLGMGNYLDYLKDCREVQETGSDNISQKLMSCPPIPEQEVFDKLETIKDLKGIKECDNNINFKCDEIIKDCNNITNINFKSSALSGGHSPTYVSIILYECKNGKQYLYKLLSPKPRLTISRIQIK